MSQTSRRDFIKHALAASGAAALIPYAAAGARGETPASSPATGDPVAMAIARWRAEELAGADLATVATRLTEEAVTALGGMSRFVSEGDVVWIKPNIAWNRAPELAATTNPDVVATLTRLCLDAGAKKVKVGDHTCHDAKLTYVTSGIGEAVRSAGGEVVFLDKSRFRMMKIDGQRIKEWPIYPEIVESDLVINVPIVKHHGLSKATLCMKNYMGVIGGQINTWHQALETCLVDITRFMRPRLTVMDAVRILTAHGPQGGNPADVALTGLVAAGTDIVALDALGSELLGHAPGDIRSVTAGFEAGLGQMDYSQLVLKESTIS